MVNRDPDPALKINVYPDPDLKMNANPDPGEMLPNIF
jgi:hypothetical protein